MTTKDIIEIILGSGGLLGIFILVFRMGRLVQKVDTISNSLEDFKVETKKNFSHMKDDTDKKFFDMKADTDKKLSEIKVEMVKSFIEVKSEIKDIKNNLNCIEVQLGKLETRVEERTLRVVHSDPSMA